MVIYKVCAFSPVKTNHIECIWWSSVKHKHAMKWQINIWISLTVESNDGLWQICLLFSLDFDSFVNILHKYSFVFYTDQLHLFIEILDESRQTVGNWMDLSLSCMVWYIQRRNRINLLINLSAIQYIRCNCICELWNVNCNNLRKLFIQKKSKLLFWA